MTSEPTPWRIELGQRLRAVRESVGVSQLELEGRSGIDRRTIGRIEKAIMSPSAEIVARLATALDVHVSELTDHPVPQPPAQ